MVIRYGKQDTVGKVRVANGEVMNWWLLRVWSERKMRPLIYTAAARVDAHSETIVLHGSLSCESHLFTDQASYRIPSPALRWSQWRQSTRTPKVAHSHPMNHTHSSVNATELDCFNVYTTFQTVDTKHYQIVGHSCPDSRSVSVMSTVCNCTTQHTFRSATQHETAL